MEELKTTMIKQKSYLHNFLEALRKRQVIISYRKEKVMVSCENFCDKEWLIT
tara:strand:- start:121 stop:276 length:156 start_codon:yes stop_codon:yes gene_type:complete